MEPLSASPIAPKYSEAAAEFPVSRVSLYSLHFSSPEHFSRESEDCCHLIPRVNYISSLMHPLFVQTKPRLHLLFLI